MSEIQKQQLVQNAERTADTESKLLKVLLEAPSIFLILEGPDMVITFANQPLLASWGRDHSIIGQTLLEALPELEHQPYPKLLKRVFTTGKQYIGSEAKATIRKEGKQNDVYYNYVYQPMTEDDGTVTGIIVMANDITDQVTSRKKIEESRTRLELITDAVPSLVSYVDKHQRYQFNNRQYEHWFGHSRNELKGKLLSEVVGEKAYHELKPHVEKALSGTRVHLEHLIPYKDGGNRYVNIDYVPDIVDGEVKGFFAVINDMTQRKKFEDELERKVQERTQDIRKANLRLEQMNKELASFAYISSHDLQEPLRKIQMFSKRVIEKEFAALSDEGKNYLKRMDNAAGRMQQLINDLLEYSRTATAPKHFEYTDLNELLDDVKIELKEKIVSSHTTIHSDRLPRLKIIPFQFRQLFCNIISNSIKFSRKNIDPVIGIKYSKIDAGDSDELGNQPGHKISFIDNGIGFSQQYNNQIFEVFQRLHGRNEFEGTGIGLSIVKRIVENHSGTITSEGVEGKGATFHIFLPELQP
jgi:PAS domain S-box-containing protein